MDFRISYAQNREDLLIAAFFPDVEAGHYVDVGASDPTYLSVTRLFYERGWSGINVEPIPELAERLRAERPRDVTVQAGLAETAGTRQFRQYAGSGLSTTNPEMMEMYADGSTPEASEFRDYSITITTLAAVLSDHPLPHIHFAKIDVEGSEFEVLNGNDWDAFRPELICIETDHMVRDWAPLLAEAGYEQVFHDGLNAYLLASEARDRARHFRYSQAILTGPVIVTPEVAEQLGHVAELRSQKKQLARQLEQLAQQSAAERDELAEVNARLSDEVEGLRRHVEGLAQDIELRDAALAAERSVSAIYATREAEMAATLYARDVFIADVLSSQSWRYTYPIRRSIGIVKARIPRRALRWVWHRIKPAVAAARTPATLKEADMTPDGAAVLERLEARAEP